MGAQDCRAADASLVGQFRWNTVTDELRWSTGTFALHGYRPNAVVPTIDLVLSHKAGDDRQSAEAMIQRARALDHHFSNYHHIVDVNGRRRTVLTVGSSRTDPGTGHRLGMGFIADVTAEAEAVTHEAIVRANRHRAVINQAQGAVMAVYGIGADAAFSLLTWYSQNHNIKLYLLAQRVVAVLEHQQAETNRAGMDRLLFDEATRPTLPEEVRADA
jgi:hypothetical protein